MMESLCMTKTIGAKMVLRGIICNHGDYSIPYRIGGRLKGSRLKRIPA